jgi:hypothetical protein
VRLRSEVERGKRSARNWHLPSGHEAREGEARSGETCSSHMESSESERTGKNKFADADRQA